jgi:hypothetical protein
MTRQCAWCGNGMGVMEPLDDPAITHGICLSCREEMRIEIAVAWPAGSGIARRVATTLYNAAARGAAIHS